MIYPDFPVESGIPMPEDERRPGGKYDRHKYPWRLMEVGDSFFVSAASETGSPPPKSLAVYLHRMKALITYQHSKRPERRFEARIVESYGEHKLNIGVRVWRTV